MKIFIVTDLEGASGVFKFGQVREKQNPLFHEAMEYLMGDIAAVVKGLREAGVKDIAVLDGHNGGNNFIPHLMVSGARYVTGAPPCRKWGLDASCDGLILLGYHAMWGTKDGVLYHTQSSSSEHRYWYNGVESGELAQAALYAGHFGVPPIMVSGDEATCREARKFFGKACVTIAVKKGLTREAAILYPFEETRQALYEGARRAVAAIPRCKTYKVRLPIRAKVQYFEVVGYPSQTRIVTRQGKITDLSNYGNITNF
ncbi:MAG: M55 family metallopeptidase [Verrucomicrobia bacterium]|nr:M55 family metallopeptidase [Verrucomicrobiota bacterium]MCG2678687.1 M55 family metallopeptidase [Kiritimatiellia bacterium]MBU4248508.1 M55 family metallopeptidase [Verrucomicrobiota bacterium]MBU4291320.1 M55 family metallopeptidase [Verrucomicrobiota bacterium]MBU4429069.1 M55 family metallopeptidase [Verrucomicrobiota bacterium]